MSTPLDIVFAGTPLFAATLLQALLSQDHHIVAVYTQPDRQAGRGRKLRASPVKQLADHAGLAVRQPEGFDERECAYLSALSADVMLVCAYGLLLPRQALDLPRLGCINVHTSLLPRWRGAAPIQRALLAGDEETGISFMQMVEVLDAGPVLHQARCEIDPGDTTASLRERLTQIACDEMPEVLGDLAEGRIESKAQDSSKVCHAPKVDKDEALIDWREPAVQIERKVRAFNDWPVAYTFMGEERLRIWEAHCLDRQTDAVSGTVLEARRGIEVAAGEGVLGIDVLQLPGGKAMSADDFLNAHNICGQCFSTRPQVF